ncbi:hypothetical protein REH65_24815 [Saccharopolyspora sp. ID03-671]|uniref:hypothetical protein n=1 Tax=Saccharopolyspora sp. ID03-671 TaxID=3073066 RepID=UPI0032440CF1
MKTKDVADNTADDVLDLMDTETAMLAVRLRDIPAFYRSGASVVENHRSSNHARRRCRRQVAQQPIDPALEELAGGYEEAGTELNAAVLDHEQVPPRTSCR